MSSEPQVYHPWLAAEDEKMINPAETQMQVLLEADQSGSVVFINAAEPTGFSY
jgi:hypothetical protein